MTRLQGRDIFNGHIAFFKDIYAAVAAANIVGYDYILWNDTIYNTKTLKEADCKLKQITSY